ncbi:MAG: GNAT family N-acetyltransferase [Chloroflexota bacterium]
MGSEGSANAADHLVLPPGIRPFRPDDADAVLAAMLAALERDEFEGLDRHWIEGSVKRMVEEPEHGVVAEDDGRIAGWVYVLHDDLHVDLPFRRRGHGTRLAAAGRLLAPRAGLPYFRAWVPRRPEAEAFARAAGMAYHSSLFQLRLDPSAPEAAETAAVFGEGFVARPLEPGADDPAFVALVNEIFLDHPFPLVLDLEVARRVHGAPEFDRSTILLVAPATDPGSLVAFCRVGTHRDDDGRLVGEVKLLGVRRPWRGRGIARQLVRWGIGACRARGVEDTYLAVEGENEHAVALYESEGFGRFLEWPHWAAEPL